MTNAARTIKVLVK